MRKFFEEFLDSENLYVRGEVSADDFKIIQPHLMPDNIKSAIVWLIPYYTGKHQNRNVSLYAVSRDYHLYARGLKERLCSKAKEIFPDEEFYVFCDSSPVNEVALAVTAGLGALGKNRLLINEKYGSFVFIGCMLATLDAESPVNMPKIDCLGCGNCIKNCSFLAENREYCMSELNQRKHLTDEELKIVMAEKIRWGCDVCQEVCPMNKRVEATPIEFFYKDIIENVSADMLRDMPKEKFCQRAYSWRGKNTVLRNFSDSDK